MALLFRYNLLINNLINKTMKANIVGQEKITKEVERILSIFQASEGQVRPHFILMLLIKCLILMLLI